MSWLRGNVGVMIVSWFLFAISNALTFPYLSKYMQLMGASDVDIGVAASLSSLANMLAVLPGGVLTDAIGRRRSIIIGTWGITLTQFLYMLAPNWWIFMAVYIVDSALHFYQPALAAVLLDSLPPERRGGGMMLTAVLPQIPWLFLPPIGGYLLDRFGLLGMRLSFMISGVISASVALFRMRALRETIEVRRVEPRKIVAMSVESLEFWRGFGELDAFVKYAVVMGLISNFAAVPAQRFGVLYATEVLGLDNTLWGVLQSALAAVAIVLGVVLTPVIDKAPRDAALLAGTALSAVGFFAVGLWRSVAVFAVALLMINVGLEVMTAIRRAVIGDRVKPNSRGRVMGQSLAFEYMGVVFGGFAGGLLYSLSPPLSFLASSVLLFASSSYLLLYIARSPRT
ncbi:MFS transporter [Thermoproteus tenax]|uniref:Permease of the major facilitator superfamily n=1 Tax=Thermoproteus tenax (strain ATCC 35583 / DSM 2078 / JCM 9277 / NBRC 100435 / Kra 1) TaxID=768679 RepID=G4RMF1_THETK|nr:MFS transporter [Thermoproteus tenax]CCC80782.1 permease of the major facilitator superfamily [Thermoproteus tenax Kra 1]